MSSQRNLDNKASEWDQNPSEFFEGKSRISKASGKVFKDFKVDDEISHTESEGKMSDVRLNEIYSRALFPGNFNSCVIKHLPGKVDCDYLARVFHERRKVPTGSAARIDRQVQATTQLFPEEVSLPAVKVTNVVPDSVDDSIVGICDVVEVTLCVQGDRPIQLNTLLAGPTRTASSLGDSAKYSTIRSMPRPTERATRFQGLSRA